MFSRQFWKRKVEKLTRSRRVQESLEALATSREVDTPANTHQYSDQKFLVAYIISSIYRFDADGNHYKSSSIYCIYIQIQKLQDANKIGNFFSYKTSSTLIGTISEECWIPSKQILLFYCWSNSWSRRPFWTSWSKSSTN